MPNFVPYRLACTESPGLPVKGCCFQNNYAPSVVSQFVNTTLAFNPISSTYTAPYGRGAKDNSAATGCEVFGNCTSPSWGPCQPWNRPFENNIFLLEGTYDFGVKHKKGFKNVQASKFWQGIWSYTNLEGCSGVNNVCGNPATSSFRSYQNNPDNTRYLKLAISASFADTISGIWADGPLSGTPASGTVNHSLDIAWSIDKNSGLVTLGGFTISPNCGGFTAFPRNNDCTPVNGCLANTLGGGDWSSPDGAYTVALWNWQDIINHMTTYVVGTNETLSFNLALGTFSRTITDGGSHTLFSETILVTATSFQYNSTANVYGDNQTYQGNIEAVGSTPVEVIVISVNGTLSDPYFASDLYNDVCGTGGLLDQWDLTNDEVYPWRTDTRVGVAPLVVRDEIQTISLSAAFYAQDFGNPVANSNNSYDPDTTNLPSPTWLGRCGVVLNPDPSTGTAIVVIPFSGVNPGDVIGPLTIASPFQGPITSYAVSGTWPPGVTFNSSTGTYSGTVSGSVTAGSNYGVTVTVTGPPSVTGNIVGAPLPAGYGQGTGPEGQGGYFQFGWFDYRGCCCTPSDGGCVSDQWTWYQYAYGGSNAGFNSDCRTQLPLNCTNWTNRFEAVGKPQGAWLFYNDQSQYGPVGDCDGQLFGSLSADTLFACKYAEILDTWPSQNFDRPGGADKFSYDQTRCYCAQNASGTGPGSTWNITNFDTTVPPNGTDFTGIWGGPSVGGFYAVSGYTGGVLTLGAQVYSVPSNWVNSSGDGSAFGKLRFSNAPALLGRIAVTSSGSLFTFTVAQPTFGMDASQTEVVDLFDVNMNPVATGVTATRVSDSQFSIPGGAYPAAVWVMIHGAPAYYFNDGDPKGDFVLLEWMADTRSIGENTRLTGVLDCNGNQVFIPSEITYVRSSCCAGNPADGGGCLNGESDSTVTFPGNGYAAFCQVQACVPYNPCKPRVVCISPNGESFPNGVTYPFPDYLAPGSPAPNYEANQFCIDETYGSKWWAWVQVTMTDLLWQQPHAPCGFVNPLSSPAMTLAWKMDDQSCPADIPEDMTGLTTKYYAFEPQVEARITIPCSYGPAQNVCGPSLPAGIQIGWLSPVTNSSGEIAFPPPAPLTAADSTPGGATTAWLLHIQFCEEIANNCRFNYNYPGCN